MTEKELLYAARCNGGAASVKKAEAYIQEHQKEEYTCDDWRAIFYSDPEPIKTGGARPLMNPISEPGNHGYTTHQWT